MQVIEKAQFEDPDFLSKYFISVFFLTKYNIHMVSIKKPKCQSTCRVGEWKIQFPDGSTGILQYKTT